MKTAVIVRIATDISMTVLILLLMCYSLVGKSAHEWLGSAIFVLFILHQILNRNWYKNLFQGCYTGFRMLQTVSVALCLLSMLGSMVSGIVLSQEVFSFLNINSGRAWARTLHLLSSHWSFVLVSFHLGLNLNMLFIIVQRRLGSSPPWKRSLLRVLAVLIAAYGAYAFAAREIGAFLLLQSTLVFINFEGPLGFFFLDYLAAMGLLIFIGYYLGQACKRLARQKPNQHS